MYEEDISKSERIRLLKNEYGVGGYSHMAIGGISQEHNASGIKIKLQSREEKYYKWDLIHDLISELIIKGEY